MHDTAPLAAGSPGSAIKAGNQNRIEMKNVIVARNTDVYPNNDWLDRNTLGLYTVRFVFFELDNCTFGDLAGDRSSGIGTVDSLVIRNSLFHHIGNG